MALNQAEFQATADEIFADAIDGNITKPATFSLPGFYDPITDTQKTPYSETVDAIVESYNSGQIDGQLIQQNDKMILVRNSQFKAINPRTDGMTLTINGSELVIVSAELDPADVVWTVQVRGTIAQPFNGEAEPLNFLATFNGDPGDGAENIDTSVNEDLP